MTRSGSAHMNGKMVGAGTFGLLMASAFGAVLGMLFAPKPGPELRSQVADKARKLARKFKRNGSEMKNTLRSIFGEVTEDLEHAYYAVREEVMERIDDLEPEEASRAANRGIIKSTVNAIGRGRDWTRSQMDRFVAHLEDEFDTFDQDRD